MRLNDPLFPATSTDPSLTDKVLGVVGGLVKLMTLQQIKNIVDSSVTVENVLTSTSTTSALSANQGKVLKAAIDAIPAPTTPITVVDALNSNSTTSALSAAQGKALEDTKAPLASPAFTGNPTAPTATSETDNDEIATTAFVHDITDAIVTALGDKCPLVEGKVPSENLPSYVDDALEFANLAAFPVTGEGGKIYIAANTNLIYRWTGSTYVLIGDGTSVDVVGVGANAFPRYDIAQTLSDVAKSQLLTNIGAKKSYNLLNKTSSYTLALADFQNDVDLYDKVYLRMNLATANNVTVDTSLTTLPNLTEISIRNVGTGFTTLVASGTTLNGILVFNTVNEVKTLITVGVNEWDVVGALT